MHTANSIPLTAIVSSQIAAIGHDEATSTLAIQFLSKGAKGNVYHYANFTKADYAALVGAESIGSHFYKSIKPKADKHPFKNMGMASATPTPTKLSKELLAGLLTGREYGKEMAKEEEQQAKAAGLIVIFGASDDLMEFRGFVNDERGAPTVALIDAQGLLPFREDIEQDDEALKDYFARSPLVRAVDAVWCNENGWAYRTSIPHATFEIIENGEPYCRGIVIDVADLALNAAQA